MVFFLIIIRPKCTSLRLSCLRVRSYNKHNFGRVCILDVCEKEKTMEKWKWKEERKIAIFSSTIFLVLGLDDCVVWTSCLFFRFFLSLNHVWFFWNEHCCVGDAVRPCMYVCVFYSSSLKFYSRFFWVRNEKLLSSLRCMLCTDLLYFL